MAQVGLWSSEKLDILRCYLGGSPARGGFLPATQQAGERYYLDLFAGPGQNQIGRTGQFIDGSPLVALKAGPPPFTRLFWVDALRRNANSLRAHVRDYRNRDISVLEGDANTLVDEVLRQLPRLAPSFAFLDPWGAELHWETVRKLAQHRPGPNRVELFILFAYNQGLVRLLPHDPVKMKHESVLDRLMPDPAGWRHAYAQMVHGHMAPPAMRRDILNLYVAGLESLGYSFVPPPRLITTPRGQPLYFLVFASNHSVGGRIMTWCLRHVRDTRIQSSFLGYEQQY